ncbi:MAG: PAS domain S-box protein [Candidatus Neomarinimicrobiota bacterium]
MFDAIIECLLAVVTGSLFLFLWYTGRKKNLFTVKGWLAVVAGTGFIFLGSVLDLLTNFLYLRELLFTGVEKYYGEKLVGYLGGFSLLLLGLYYWIQSMQNDRLRSEREKQYRQIIERTSNLVYTADINGKFTYVNPAAEKFTGYSEAELTAMYYTDLIRKDWQEKTRNFYINQFINQIAETSFEFPIITRTGHEHWVEQVVILQFEQERISGFHSIVRDVTRQKNAEEALYRLNDQLEMQEKRIRDLYRLSAQSGVDIDQQLDETLKIGAGALGLDIGIISRIQGDIYTVLFFYDPAGNLFHGQTFELGKTYCSLTVAADDIVAIDHMGKSSYSGHPCYRAFQMESYIGSPILVNGQRFGVLNFSSPKPRKIPFTQSDRDFVKLMGSWVSAMLERKQAYDRISHSEEKIRAILTTAVDGIITITASGRIESFNRAAEQIFGYSADEVLGSNINILMPEPHSSQHDGYLNKYLKSGQAKVIGKGREMVGCRKDGTIFSMDLSVGEVLLNDQRLYTGIVRDITERKKAERELQRAKQSAEVANQTKSEFLANMSHELRTPLNSVIGFSNILLKNKDQNLSAADIKYLERILANGKHLLDLINDVLDLSKIEAGRVELEIINFSVAELIAELIEQFESQVKDKGFKLVCKLPADPAPLLTDPSKLKQVLLNLLSNAAKFTREGNVTIELIIDPTTKIPVRIDVSDTGIGIPENRLAAIFNEFEQVESSTSRKYGGTGLGLSISKSLCELMGFNLTVSSTAGQGSTFSIHLGDQSQLADRPPVRTRDTGRRKSKAAAEYLSLAGRRILVIDDDPDSRTLIEQILDEAGCEIITADTGQNGLEQARTGQPELIALDLKMPGMDGLKTLQQLKADPQTKTIPVVIVSIVANDNRGHIVGAVDYVQKPLQRDELLWAVHRNLIRGGNRVLIIDDQVAVRQQIRKALKNSGIEITEAADGREALKILQNQDQDLILLDLLMPKMDGRELLRTLRSDEKYASLPVIIITGAEIATAEKEYLQSEVEAIVAKDNNLTLELPRIVAEVLNLPVAG